MWKFSVTAILALCAMPAFGQELYQVTALNSSQDNFQILDANSKGELAGFIFSPQRVVEPAVFSDGAYHFLPDPPTSGDVFPDTINNAGDLGIAQSATVLSPRTGYLYSGGQYTALVTPQGNLIPTLVGPDGALAGYVSPSYAYAIYRHGTATFLPDGEIPTAVNNRGDFIVSNQTGGAFVNHPDGTTTELPTINGGVYDRISDTGIVVGHIPFSFPAPGVDPAPTSFFIIQNNQATFISDPFPQTSLVADAIDATGTIALNTQGQATPNQGSAFIYENGQLINFDDLVIDHSYHFVSPLSLSDDGTIYLLAQTSDNRELALQLTPIPASVPEPITLALLPTALAGWQVRRRFIRS